LSSSLSNDVRSGVFGSSIEATIGGGGLFNVGGGTVVIGGGGCDVVVVDVSLGFDELAPGICRIL
jgi:hypothetical protein